MKIINKTNTNNFVTSKTNNLLGLLFLMISLSSCDAIAGIFKAGMGVGIFIVLAIIVIIILIARGMGKK